MTFKIGFTGTQNGMTHVQKCGFLHEILSLRDQYGQGIRDVTSLQFHQGQCIGSDFDALRLVKSQGGFWTVSHPPINKAKVHDEECMEVWPEKEYLDRNHDIVDVCDLLIVAPKSQVEEIRSGTWATYRYAKRLKKDVLVLWPTAGLGRRG